MCSEIMGVKGLGKTGENYLKKWYLSKKYNRKQEWYSKFVDKGLAVEYKGIQMLSDLQGVELTKNEFRILQVLMEQKGSVISRDLLMTKLWETDSYVDDNTLTVNVTRLRKKLEDVGLVQFIITKKGMGYLIEE